MPRTSTRKAATKRSSSDRDDDMVPLPIAPKKARTGFTGIDRVFNTFSNKSAGVIEPEGIEALCKDMGIDHTDVRLLMLAWKMKSEKQGYFTQEEWRRGLKELKVDSLIKLKKALPKLEEEVSMPTNFLDFYSFAFKYNLTEEKQKGVEIETVCVLLELVLGSQFGPQIDSFVKFLKVQKDYRVMNMDQWMGFLRFFQEISFPDMQNYDLNDSWPLILDNFVEWINQNNV